MSIPAIESWTPRELDDATKMNKRVSDVHRFLQNPPAARVVGMSRSDMPGTGYSVLPFYPIGDASTGAYSYETWPGMVPRFKADWTMQKDTAWQLVAPLDGRYRITLNGAWNTNTELQDGRHGMWVGIGVNPKAGTGQAIVDAAVDAFSPPQSTGYTLCGGHTTTVKLRAGDKVQFAARALTASVFGWAREDVTAQYKWGSFAEIRWIGSH